MKSILLTSLLFAFALTEIDAQHIEKVVFNEFTNDYYLVIPPNTAEIKGVLLLLPGFGLEAESIFPETKLHKVTYTNEILAVVNQLK